ncbi:MAG TPA: IPT/TIG domain-containing protein, partial [Chloroflexota bacterium]|nr:IPT/TIG domain-containing protein [Chloroflexota bacterium]
SSITIKAPAGSGTASVVVGGADNLTGANLTFDYGPAITGMSPATGKTGSMVRISGGNLPLESATALPVTWAGATLPPCVSGATALATGCVSAHSPTSMTIKAPAGSGSASVSVDSADILPGANLSFDYGPAITKLS